ncbi:MAG: hypothetical protein AAF363_14795 [Bacteroidota bacterium]
MKERYGEKIEDGPSNAGAKEKNTTNYDELNDYRNRIRSKGKFYKIISSIFMLAGLVLLVYMIFKWIGEKLL